MILNVYKEKDWTSFDVVAKIRGILKASRDGQKVKVGHAGTLDPLAEGVLVILTDSDTKLQDKIMNSKKEYYAKIAFGAFSPTYDLEGQLKYAEIPESLNIQEELNSILPKYIGQIKQKVPPYSAVKVNGKKLYELSRNNKVDNKSIPTKDVEIYSIYINSLKTEEIIQNGEKVTLPLLTCTITCGSGTYIRSLAHDLGQDLGIGGVLAYLKRTKVGNYDVKDSKKIDELKF